MAAPVTPYWKVPRTPETHMGRPVAGRTLTAMARALTHLNVYQARGFAPASVYIIPAWTAANASDVGYIIGQVDRYESLYLPYFVPLGVDLIHVSFMCLSYETGGHQAPAITVNILAQSGADVDKGCSWSRDSGQLPGSEIAHGDKFWLPPYLAESVARFAAADPAAGTTDPRRLAVGASAIIPSEGTVVIIKISAIRVRFVSVHILPVPPVTL